MPDPTPETAEQRQCPSCGHRRGVWRNQLGGVDPMVTCEACGVEVTSDEWRDGAFAGLAPRKPTAQPPCDPVGQSEALPPRSQEPASRAPLEGALTEEERAKLHDARGFPPLTDDMRWFAQRLASERLVLAEYRGRLGEVEAERDELAEELVRVEADVDRLARDFGIAHENNTRHRAQLEDVRAVVEAARARMWDPMLHWSIREAIDALDGEPRVPPNPEPDGRCVYSTPCSDHGTPYPCVGCREVTDVAALDARAASPDHTPERLPASTCSCLGGMNHECRCGSDHTPERGEFEEPCSCGMWVCKDCRPENFEREGEG